MSDPDVAYELSRDAIAHQLAAADGLDAKIAALMAVGCTLLGLVAALLAVTRLGDLLVFFVVSTVTIPWLVLSALSIEAYQIVQFNACPDLDDVFNDHDGKPVEEIKWNTARTLKSYFNDNLPAIDRKARAVSVGLRCLVLETGIAVGWLAAIAWGLDL